jgi:hypothetical protein
MRELAKLADALDSVSAPRVEACQVLRPEEEHEKCVVSNLIEERLAVMERQVDDSSEYHGPRSFVWSTSGVGVDALDATCKAASRWLAMLDHPAVEHLPRYADDFDIDEGMPVIAFALITALTPLVKTFHCVRHPLFVELDPLGDPAAACAGFTPVGVVRVGDFNRSYYHNHDPSDHAKLLHVLRQAANDGAAMIYVADAKAATSAAIREVLELDAAEEEQQNLAGASTAKSLYEAARLAAPGHVSGARSFIDRNQPLFVGCKFVTEDQEEVFDVIAIRRVLKEKRPNWYR